MDVSEVLNDLLGEHAALDDVVSTLGDDQMALATPSPRWSVGDQLGHLAFFDRTAALAITDEAAFLEHKNGLMRALGSDTEGDDATLGAFRAMDAAGKITDWRDARATLAAAGATLANDTRVEWYGPSMGSKSFLTARLMETWAHGQDICDTVGATRESSDRIRHIVQLGVITRGWSYMVRGEQAPEGDVRVELAAPSGAAWAWGDESATDSVTGSAEDFCLVVTQRRHVSDTALDINGELAIDWMSKAQAFAGAPTTGPAPQGIN